MGLENEFFTHVISIISLLFISSISALLAKKLKTQYTIFVFLIGFIIFHLNEHFIGFDSVSSFSLTGDLVFFVLLPILIFESAYNIPYKKILGDIHFIGGLSIIGYLLSVFLIAFGLKFILGLFGFDVDILLLLLFGTIISATDPVSVLSIFKELGISKRLTYIFEGESLVNDATAVAFLLVLLEIIRIGALTTESAIIGGVSFFGMLIGGVFWGLFLGTVFSKLLGTIRNFNVELTFMLLSAHIVFISSEVISHFARELAIHTGSIFVNVFQISPIIATTVAALVLGNYGKYKISKKIRSFGHYFYDYFGFISNSLIFILMGFLLGENIKLIVNNLSLIFIVILVVIIARFLSVYTTTVPINFFLRKEDKIPPSWIGLLSWGSLRGAIAIALVLITPKDLQITGWDTFVGLTPHDFLIITVFSCVVFTLIVKTISFPFFIRFFNLNTLDRQYKYTILQVKEKIHKDILNKINKLKDDPTIISEILKKISSKYEFKSEFQNTKNVGLSHDELDILFKKYALGIEKKVVIESFEKNEIDELSLRKILSKIEFQVIRLEKSLNQTKMHIHFFDTVREKIYFIFHFLNNKDKIIAHKFLFYRARCITAFHVISSLKRLKNDFCEVGSLEIKELIAQYEQWLEDASSKKYEIYKNNKKFIEKVEEDAIENLLDFEKKEILKNLKGKQILNGELFKIIKSEV